MVGGPALRGDDGDAITVGLLHLDGARRASFAGRPLDLPPRALELLAVLVANRHRVVSRIELSDRLGLRRARSIDVLLSLLRRELGCDFVRNVPKRGWIVVPEVLGRNVAAPSTPAEA
jgi:DNA-binding response OmpR family regulator